jgi:hypothetical protein
MRYMLVANATSAFPHVGVVCAKPHVGVVCAKPRGSNDDLSQGAGTTGMHTSVLVGSATRTGSRGGTTTPQAQGAGRTRPHVRNKLNVLAKHR